MDEIFSSLRNIVKTMGGTEMREATARAVFRRVAGEELSRHTAVVKLSDNSRLVIAVADKTWQRQMESIAPQMIYRFNAELGAGSVKRIEFCIDPAKAVAARSGVQVRTDTADFGRRALSELTPELTDAAAIINDDQLRDKFLSAAANGLLRKKELEKGNGS